MHGETKLISPPRRQTFVIRVEVCRWAVEAYIALTLVARCLLPPLIADRHFGSINFTC